MISLRAVFIPLILFILLIVGCKKEEPISGPDLYSKTRLISINIYSNDSLFMLKTMDYDAQNRLEEIEVSYYDENNDPIPFKRQGFEYISEDRIESVISGNLGGAGWIDDVFFSRIYEDGRLVEYTASYSDDSRAFYTYNEYGLSETKYLSLSFKANDTCIIEKYLYDENGFFAGADLYHFCKGSDSAERKVRYIRNDDQQLIELQIYATYLTGHWEMNTKLEFTYNSAGHMVECLNYKLYNKILTPITRFDFAYNLNGTLKELLFTELYSGETEKYIFTYEKGIGNFHEMRTLYNYSTYRYWMPDVNISGHLPLYY